MLSEFFFFMLLLVLKSEVNATYCLYYCYKENPALFAKFITKHRQCATFLRNHINSVMNPVPTLEEEECLNFASVQMDENL